MSNANGSIGKQRIEALSDGIYAIALTLLVLELKLPSLGHAATNADLLNALGALLPNPGSRNQAGVVFELNLLGYDADADTPPGAH